MQLTKPWRTGDTRLPRVPTRIYIPCTRARAVVGKNGQTLTNRSPFHNSLFYCLLFPIPFLLNFIKIYRINEYFNFPVNVRDRCGWKRSRSTRWKIARRMPIAIYTVRLLAASLLHYYQRSKLPRKILTLRLRQPRFPPRKIALVHGRH